MSSHKLGTHQQQYKRYQPTTNSILSMSILGGDNVQAQINDHDNFALQFDDYVNKIFTIMKEKSYLDNAVVVIFGDHGDAIGEHGYTGHYHSLYQEEIHVPIILWASKGIDLGIKNRMFATLMDIPPILFHYLDIPLPESFLGFPLQLEQPEKIAYLDSKRNTIGVLYQKRNKLYKLIASKDEYKDPQLFELTSDPSEQFNIQSAQQKITKRLIKVLKNRK
jgi:arylsulfatase A-like enzyme